MSQPIDKGERELQITRAIKSNLISEGITSEQINKIAIEMTKDILDILDNFDGKNNNKDEEE
jgi:hypothetical protein